MIVPIDQSLLEVAGSAIARLKVVYPELRFETEYEGIAISGENVEERVNEITKSVMNVLYQEKIFRDTLDIRKRIYLG